MDYTSRLKVVALWESAEDTDDDGRYDECAKNGLQEDGVLNLAEGRLLDPDFAVKDLASNVALLILGYPWLILVAIA